MTPNFDVLIRKRIKNYVGKVYSYKIVFLVFEISRGSDEILGFSVSKRRPTSGLVSSYGIEHDEDYVQD